MMWSWLLFKKKDVAICPRAKTARIIQSGPYLISRNPMYLGMIMIMLGPALFVGTVTFYLSVLVYFLVLNIVFCPFEEAKLLTAFGHEYAQYCGNVRRWL
jgi:protein-S-isoprenylcysteine O-methyltransferase Ste14